MYVCVLRERGQIKCNNYDERMQGIIEEENVYSLENLERLLERKGIELSLKEGLGYIFQEKGLSEQK